jgi:hypothetical protein
MKPRWSRLQALGKEERKSRVYMGASEPEPSTECKVCGKIFDSVEDLAAHNREAHVSGSNVAGSI